MRQCTFSIDTQPRVVGAAQHLFTTPVDPDDLPRVLRQRRRRRGPCNALNLMRPRLPHIPTLGAEHPQSSFDQLGTACTHTPSSLRKGGGYTEVKDSSSCSLGEMCTDT